MSNPTQLPDLAYDKDMDRYYIPLPGGWEIQTKGKGSTFRIAHAGSGRRWMVLDDQLYDPLVALANAVRDALSRRAQPEGEAPQAGWTVEKDAHGRFCVRDSGGARSITEEDEPTLYRFFSAQHAATLSPLCGAQPAESGKESVHQHEAIEAAVDQCFPKQDSPHASVNDKIGAARLAFRKGYRAALAAQQAAATGAKLMTYDEFFAEARRLGCKLPADVCAALAAAPDYSAPGTPEAPKRGAQLLAELLGAPSLYSQVYVAATVGHGWSGPAARDAADAAVQEYGDSPAGLIEDLQSILDEVLRVDGAAAPKGGA